MTIAVALFLVAPPPQSQARQAAEAFSQVQLFSEGGGLHITPGLYRLYDLVERPEWPLDVSEGFRRLGFNVEGRRVVGLFGVDSGGSRVGVIGCAGCHSGRAAGRLFYGLGNKTIDVALIALVAEAFARPFRWVEAFFPESGRQLIENTFALTARLQDPPPSSRFPTCGAMRRSDVPACSVTALATAVSPAGPLWWSWPGGRKSRPCGATATAWYRSR